MIDFEEAAAGNRRRSRALVATIAVLAALLGLACDATLGTFAGPFPVVTLLLLGGVALASAAARALGDRMVLASLGAIAADPSDPEQRQLLNVVAEMAVASGLPAPRTWVIPDPAPNALATGRDPAHASIAVTTGLLDKLDRAETQGVVAHELAHIGNRDTRLGVTIAILVGAVALLADAAWHLRHRGHRGARAGRGDGTVVLLPVLLLASVLAPLASRLVAFAISRQREYLADATAIRFTRNPLALASALETIGADRRPTRSGTRGTAHLFFARPRAGWAEEREGALADLWATHPPIAARVARLRAMAYKDPDAPLRA